jgi:hypothetical protein
LATLLWREFWAMWLAQFVLEVLSALPMAHALEKPWTKSMQVSRLAKFQRTLQPASRTFSAAHSAVAWTRI